MRILLALFMLCTLCLAPAAVTAGVIHVPADQPTIQAGTDINGDGLDDVIAGRGPDPEADTEVKVFSYFQGEVVEWMAIDAFEGLTHGTNVAAGRF